VLGRLRALVEPSEVNLGLGFFGCWLRRCRLGHTCPPGSWAKLEALIDDKRFIFSWRMGVRHRDFGEGIIAREFQETGA
jgi:hypothetical protein